MDDGLLLGVDLGTTHCKAGLFDMDGSLLRRATRPTATHRTDKGLLFHHPDELWNGVVSATKEVVEEADRIEIVGVTSMAEAGLLLDRVSLAPRSHVLPWFDGRSAPQADRIGQEEEPIELFRRTGMHSSYKFGLAKLLWLCDEDASLVQGSIWLSVADYIVFRLTGRLATDPTLAVRTYAFRLQEGIWDEAWIRHFGLDPGIFPEILPSGVCAGTVTAESSAATGIPGGTRVGIAGHDHVCTMLSAGITEPGPVLDSIGTAESLLGLMEPGEVGEKEFASGLALVPHVLPGRRCWLGGLSAAGGSIEWLRSQVGLETLSYDAVMELVAQAGAGPTGILYFPYLSGSGAPGPDQQVRAAFIGLDRAQPRGALMKSILEGTAYEVESVRRAAETLTGRAIGEMIAVGGGVRNAAWLHVKADVSCCHYAVPALPEATVLGAALTAAVGSGVFGLEDVHRVARRHRDAGESIEPDPETHRAYRRIYETAYLPFQEPLRRVAVSMKE